MVGRGLNTIPKTKRKIVAILAEMLWNKTAVITSNNLPKEIEFQKKEIVHSLLLPYRELKMICTLKSNQG